MNGEEIKERIDQNNKKIHEALKQFILTNDIKELLKENDKLRNLCKHQFINGCCRYCGKQEN